MSAPTPAPGDDRPREGYYPDPSIPGYVRYWNGAAWVPGTSRPAPTDGTPPTPPGSGAGTGGAVPPVEETGPHFFDEDPRPQASPSDAQHGSRPEPASAWGADRGHQSGFGGDQDRRVSWGAPTGPDPRVPSETSSTDGTATIPPAQDASDVPSGNTFVFRRPTTGQQGDSGQGGAGASGGPAFGAATPGVPGPGGPVGDEGTMTFRAVPPRTAQQGGAQGGSTGGAHGAGPTAGTFGTPGPSGSGGPAFTGPGASTSGASASGGPGASASGAPGSSGSGGPAFTGPGASTSGASASGGPGAPASGTPAFTGPGISASGAPAPNTPGFGAGKAAAERAAASQAQAGAAAQAPASAAPTALSGPQQPNPAAGAATPAAPSVPQQPTPASAPMSSGPGGGQPSWAQQVHRLAGASGEDQPVVPWKPPVDDIFQAAARRQASARPAGLGKRLAARLLDTVVVLGVTAVAAVPLGTKALDHVDEKIDAAKLSGETVTVWLLDGTTSTYLGVILAVLLIFGVLYEALPTAKWGRTLGKKLLGLEVRDIEGGEPPSFGAALRRWLVYSVPGLLAIGVVGVVWGLFDKPWRQCWHDKAAHTFVAG
ncbi:RDD family protein [Streptomyces aquilus]|uniref:RDD family protein n=1 Tax=Streptomyces aquilus TaxID=2548456 RepID=UPI0037D5C87D